MDSLSITSKSIQPVPKSSVSKRTSRPAVSAPSAPRKVPAAASSRSKRTPLAPVAKSTTSALAACGSTKSGSGTSADSSGAQRKKQVDSSSDSGVDIASTATAAMATLSVATDGCAVGSSPSAAGAATSTSSRMTSGSKVGATSTTAKARQGDDKKDGVPQPKSMSRGKVWSEEIEDAYRFQLAGFRDVTEYLHFHGEQPDRWPNGLVKVLKLKSGYFYCYNRARECEFKDVHRTKIYVY